MKPPVQDDETFRIKEMEISLSKEEWSSLRMLFPNKVTLHTQRCDLDQGDVYSLKVGRFSDKETKTLILELISAVKEEDALVIHLTKEGLVDEPDIIDAG